MDNNKCPICQRKADQVLVPDKNRTDDFLIICENESVSHGVCTNGTMLLFKNKQKQKTQISL